MEPMLLEENQSSIDECIVEFFRSHPGQHTTNELAGVFGKARNGMHYILISLAKAGMLRIEQGKRVRGAIEYQWDYTPIHRRNTTAKQNRIVLAQNKREQYQISPGTKITHGEACKIVQCRPARELITRLASMVERVKACKDHVLNTLKTIEQISFRRGLYLSPRVVAAIALYLGSKEADCSGDRFVQRECAVLLNVTLPTIQNNLEKIKPYLS